MGVIATFNYPSFAAQFPQLSYAASETVQAWWNVAGSLYLRNDGSGTVCSQAVQQNLMNLLTAHLVALFVPVPGPAGSVPEPGLVGRLANASMGSVNVTAEYASQTSQSMAWYIQTPYGAAFWEAAKALRSARWIPGPNRNPTVSGYPSFITS